MKNWRKNKMLRIKDNVNLKELEKFGFRYGTRNRYIYKTKSNGIESRMYIDLTPCNNNNNQLKIESQSFSLPEKIIDKIYDLTKANIVERVQVYQMLSKEEQMKELEKKENRSFKRNKAYM